MLGNKTLTRRRRRFIVQNTDWRWCYRVLLIWQFFQIVFLFTCVPETYVPVILKHKARRYPCAVHLVCPYLADD